MEFNGKEIWHNNERYTLSHIINNVYQATVFYEDDTFRADLVHVDYVKRNLWQPYYETKLWKVLNGSR